MVVIFRVWRVIKIVVTLVFSLEETVGATRRSMEIEIAEQKKEHEQQLKHVQQVVEQQLQHLEQITNEQQTEHSAGLRQAVIQARQQIVCVISSLIPHHEESPLIASLPDQH